MMLVRTFAFFLAVAVLAGCNTMEGLGRDIKKGGEKIEKSAERHK
jgi:predicted small secreted protein